MRPFRLAAFGLLATLTSLPASAALIVTPAGQTLGFTASTVATGFTAQSGLFGPFGLTLTGNNQILVNDYGNSTRYLFNDVDGQTVANAISSMASTSYTSGYTTLNGVVYGASDLGFVQFNNDGTVNHQIVPAIAPLFGIAGNPTSGKLIASINGAIVEIDPIANTFRTIVSGVGSIDGISISPDGSVAYVGYNGLGIIGYNISNGSVAFPFLSMSGADGTGVISSNNALNGDIVVNGNDGSVSLVDPVTRSITVIAMNAGQRGDYVAPDTSNGSLLLDYSTEVSRLSCGPGCSIGAPPPVSSTPEPSSFVLAGMGLTALLAARRKMQK